MTTSREYAIDALAERLRRHTLASLCALLFVWLWPYLALRDVFLPTDRWMTAVLQVCAWLVVGFCIIMQRERRGRPAAWMAVFFLVFVSIWYVQFFALGAPAAADADNYAYAACCCLAPFVAGWCFPLALRPLFCRWLAVLAVGISIVLTILNLTIYPVGSASRNAIFSSLNPISQAAVIAVGILALLYYRPPKAWSVGRLALLAVTGGQLLLTGSRGPIIGVMSAALLCELTPAKIHRRRLWSILVLVSLASGVYLFKSYLPESVLVRVFDVDQSLNMSGGAGGATVRVGPIWQAIELAASRPLLGWGESANPIIGFYCHNFFAQAFLETGLIGLAAVTLLMMTGGARLFRGACQIIGEGRFLFSVFLLFGLVYQFSGTPVYANQLWFLLGLAATNGAGANARFRAKRAAETPLRFANGQLFGSAPYPAERGVYFR